MTHLASLASSSFPEVTNASLLKDVVKRHQKMARLCHTLLGLHKTIELARSPDCDPFFLNESMDIVRTLSAGLLIRESAQEIDISHIFLYLRSLFYWDFMDRGATLLVNEKILETYRFREDALVLEIVLCCLLNVIKERLIRNNTVLIEIYLCERTQSPCIRILDNGAMAADRLASVKDDDACSPPHLNKSRLIEFIELLDWQITFDQELPKWNRTTLVMGAVGASDK